MRLALAAIGLVTLSACNREPLDVAPAVDLDRFQGTWHEIARMPRIAQSDCRGTTATYTREGDDRFKFVHECTLSSGAYQGSTAAARVRDPKTPAKLEVDFGGHVGDYWILEVAPDYRYAVVGHPSRDYLWILSRAPTLATGDLEVILEHSREKSFDTERLVYTMPAPLAEGTPAPKMGHGCSVGAASVGMRQEGIALAVGALGLGVFCLRRSRRRRSSVSW